ncbi:MAG: hypothetical protein IPK63_16160 [Candidatus Competibacteraceae bacterium]|nr:hypothetical protein [Candidatus Competibacteraceae bacterium]
MTVHIAVVGDRNTSNKTTKFFDDGNTTEIWTADHFDSVYAVDADSDGNVYTAGKAKLDTTDFTVNTTRKYDIDGNLLWKRYYHVTTLYGIAVNDSGDVVVVGASSGGASIVKYNASGTEQWHANHGGTTRCVAIDSSNNVYIGGDVVSSVSIRKYNSSGTQQWTANHGATVYGIAVDASGYVYICGAYTGGYCVRQYDNSGSLQWSRNYMASATSGTVYGIAVDSSQNVYVCFKASGVYGVVRKYNSSGTQQWESTYGGGSDLNATPYGISVDPAGGVWVCGTRQAAVGQLEEYNNSGTYQTEYTHGTTLWGVCAFKVVTAITTNVPALALPVVLGIPGGGPAYVMPALAIPLALAIPTPQAPTTPPLGDGQAVYRCYVTGTASLIEVPMIGFECRRRRNESTWLLVQTAGLAQATVMALRALEGIGQLVIYTGLKTGGTETLGEMLRATITDVEDTRESHGVTCKVTCRVSAVLETLQTRYLEGVYQRTREAGRRSISCTKVNPLLRPGDTVDDGVWSFVAYSITYRITPFYSEMVVQEAPL